MLHSRGSCSKNPTCLHCTLTGSPHLYWLTCTHTHCSVQTSKSKKASLSFTCCLLPLISPQLSLPHVPLTLWRPEGGHPLEGGQSVWHLTLGIPPSIANLQGLLTPAASSALLSLCNFSSRELLPAVETQTFQTIPLLLTILLPGKIPPQLTHQVMLTLSLRSSSSISSVNPPHA